MSSPVRSAHHAAMCSSMSSWRARRPAAVAQFGIRRPVAAPDGLAETRPLLVGRDRDRDPAVGAAELVDLVGAVQVLRRRGRSAVAVALQQRTVGGVLDDLLGGDVERGVDHRRLDEHSLPCAAPMFQGHQQGVERVDAGVRITDRIRLVRVAVGIAGEPTDPGCRLDDVGERRVVAPRAVQTEPGHPQHDDVGANRLHRSEIETDLVHHPRGEVLDDHIAGGDEAVEQVATRGALQVERQPLLVGVEPGEDRRLLPPLVFGDRYARDEPGAVRAAASTRRG